MTKIPDLVKQAAKLPILLPSIGIASLVYSGAIYLSSLRANLLDIRDPWWIVTVGLVLLLSPVYHVFVIQRTASSVAGQSFDIRDLPIETFGDLMLGQLLVNMLVMLGGILFLLPGIYLGLRSIYYKQVIILHKARALSAIGESFRMTANPRTLFGMFLFLAVAYGLSLVINLVVISEIQAGWVHPIAILVSTSFIAWVNVYVTLSFGELMKQQEPEETEQST